MRTLSLALAVAVVFAAGCTKLKEDPPADPPKKDEKVVGKFTRELLKAEDVRADHPDWVVEDPKAEGSDPFTALGTGYDAAIHNVAQLSWTKWMQQEKILNDDKIPPYSVAKKYVEQGSQGLPMVRPYRHWVYDQQTGDLLLMLDKEHRNKVYREKKIPIPED